MEMTINHLAKLAGISTRALRHYDEIGLLKPGKIKSNGYRIYGQQEVDRLQQIMFYKALDVPLEEIKRIMSAPTFDVDQVMNEHLKKLKQKERQLKQLIKNVENTIQARKGAYKMDNKEKFEGFKQQLIEENEQKYGKEVRQQFGHAAVETSNKKLKGMTEEQYAQIEALNIAINDTLIQAVTEGNPKSASAKKLCQLHRDWVAAYWPAGKMTNQAHLNLAQMYISDERFTAYYDEIIAGGAQFLVTALQHFYEDK